VSRSKGSARWALAVFGVLAVASVPLYLALARHEWFFLDEWDFLANRTAWNLGDLLRPHTDHWTTLPILAWRALWWTVGLRSYLPYVFLSVLAHVAVAALTRAVMRRAGVDPWIATVVAGVVLFFGAGAENIMYAFQITFTGALAFGLGQLLLADHDGPVDRRDWIGLLSGLLALLCSGVAVAMVAVVGIATLSRRSWRIALFHVAPLAAIYLLWWARYARSVTDVSSNVGDTLSFVRRSFTTAFGSLGHITGVGALIAVALVVGLVLGWRAADADARRTRLSAPLALLAGAVVFFVVTGVGRAAAVKLVGDPQSRYQYVAIVLLAPAIAVAVDVLFRRWRPVGVVAIVVLLVGVPGNIVDASHFGRREAQITKQSRAALLSIGRLPLASRAPAGLQPDPFVAPLVTIGWLRSGVASGRVPAPAHPPDAALLASNRLRLSLMQVETPKGPACAALTGPVDRRLERSDRLRIGNGAVRVQLLEASAPVGIPLTFGNALLGQGPKDHELVAVAGPLRVRVSTVTGKPAQLC